MMWWKMRQRTDDGGFCSPARPYCGYDEVRSATYSLMLGVVTYILLFWEFRSMACLSGGVKSLLLSRGSTDNIHAVGPVRVPHRAVCAVQTSFINSVHVDCGCG